MYYKQRQEIFVIAFRYVSTLKTSLLPFFEFKTDMFFIM